MRQFHTCRAQASDRREEPRLFVDAVLQMMSPQVLIHIRSEDRMRPPHVSWRSRPSSSFNPHPVRRPDETREALYTQLYKVMVSIHIRSEDRMRLGCADAITKDCGVSIHIRSEDRMRHAIRGTGAGRCDVSIHIRSEDRMRPGGGIDSYYTDDVSIHIRSEDRMRPGIDITGATVSAFQSTSGPKTG